jgi:hypothetical protein
VGTLSRVIIASLIVLPAPLNAQTASFIAQPGRIAAAVLPASVLSDGEVHQQLASGLTTTFVLAAQQRGGEGHSAVHIEIRFDLWDEVWLVRRVEFDGKEERQRLASLQSLERWWSTPIRLFAARADRVTLNVTLTVLPFSLAEGEDARAWIAKSAGVSSAEPRSSPFVAALIGTTLNARPIRSYRWTAGISFP